MTFRVWCVFTGAMPRYWGAAPLDPGHARWGIATTAHQGAEPEFQGIHLPGLGDEAGEAAASG